MCIIYLKTKLFFIVLYRLVKQVTEESKAYMKQFTGSPSPPVLLSSARAFLRESGT